MKNIINKVKHSSAMNWFKEHKKIRNVTVIVTLVAVLLIGYTIYNKSNNKNDTPTSNAYIRTVTLSKGSILDSVSASGTVASANVSSVTTSLAYTVKTINVKVGDYVKEGDVILTLDTTELTNSINKEKEQLASNVSKAQSNYDSIYNSLTSAKETRDSAKSAYDSALSAYTNAQTAYNNALSNISSFQSAYDLAQSEKNSAGVTMNNALTTLNNTMSSVEGTYCTVDSTDSNCTAVISAYQSAQNDYNNKADLLNTASNNLNTAKSNIGFDSIYQNYTNAQNTYNAASTTYTQAQNSVSSYETQLSNAKETLDNASTSDNLESLYEQLEECTLKAETSGTVTSLNATVGSRVTSTAATIQDSEDLIININIEEYDVKTVEIGMRVIITSDATDEEIIGELSQVSPTATTTGQGSTSSTFSAQVKVLNGSNGLLIGMNANTEIVIKETTSVFSVPLDAIETDEDGKTYVYEKISGSGLDMVFERVEVNVKDAQNDYYIEIDGENVYEGMIIRASAILEDAIVESTDENNMFDMNFGGGYGSMGDVNIIEMPSDMPNNNRPGNFNEGGND